MFVGQVDPCVLKVGFPEGCDAENVRQVVLKYFSVQDDVSAIERKLADEDPVMRRAITFARGLRILTQDLWECLASYILSSHKTIPAISKNVGRLCEVFGEDAGFGEFQFPSPQSLLSGGMESLKGCGCGFRAGYLLDAAAKVTSLDLDLDSVSCMPLEEAKGELMRVKGVGNKVSACVLLYGYHRLEVFPVDVWVRRAMGRYYKGSPCTAEEAEDMGSSKFGPYAGYAQQFLFHYIRNEGSDPC